MSKKFIRVNGDKVTLIHHMPFDSVNGMHKSEAELSAMGYLVDEVPEPERRNGKMPVAHYTPERGFWYEYEDAPAGPATTADIEAVNAKLDYFMMMQEVI